MSLVAPCTPHAGRLSLSAFLPVLLIFLGIALGIVDPYDFQEQTRSLVVMLTLITTQLLLIALTVTVD